MNYRLATVLAEKSLSTTGTETIDINLKDPISRIEIGHHITLGDVAMVAALAAAITKVELVDGSDVLHSLSGRENQALCIYDRRVPTMNHGELNYGADLYATLGIDFGRFLYDPELAFDPKMFRNPQLKITHDYTQLSANSSTHLLEVFAHLFDEKPISPIGFLMAKNHYTYTPAANNAFEYIDLPTDLPIRQLLLRGYQAGQDPHDVCDGFKLSEDNDKRIPIDLELEAYIRRMKGVWLPVQESWAEYASGGYHKYITSTDHMTIVQATSIEPLSDPLIGGYVKGGYVELNANSGHMAWYSSIGYLPHHCIQFPFGLQGDLNDWYDVTKLGSLRARVQAAAQFSGAEISIILQQLRRY